METVIGVPPYLPDKKGERNWNEYPEITTTSRELSVSASGVDTATMAGVSPK
jgi:hypothetical protein